MRRALIACSVAVSACGPGAGTVASPAGVEAVGAPDHFGRGILRLGDAGDRLLVDVLKPSYWTIVRFDSAGAPIAAAAMETRRAPGMTWLELPTGQNASRGTASVPNPACSAPAIDRNARADCVRRPRLIETGPALVRRGEVVILFVTAEPLRPATLEDRLHALPVGAPLMRVPALIMEGRRDLWAAYLVRR